MFRPISTSDNVVYIFVKSFVLITSSLGIVVRIPDFHLGDRGSNPGSGERIFFSFFLSLFDFFLLSTETSVSVAQKCLRNK